MAINKSITLPSGISISHHVFDLNFDYVHDLLTIVWEKYSTGLRYIGGKSPLEVANKVYPLKELPVAIKDKLTEVLSEMECWMIANDPDFKNGTRVEDNGDPIT